jgi:glycosyltransferase involved in cell wall biosynthesis
MVVGYPGQFDVYLARFLSWLDRKPLAWDIFMSIYLIAIERGLDKHSPVIVRIMRFIERLACRLPDLLLIDTLEYAHWFESTHGIPARRFCLVPTGADTRNFFPISITEDTNCRETTNDKFIVIYYGTFIPNHGVPTIVEAARLLTQDQSILFKFIGDGPERFKVEQMVQEYQLTNVEFIDWLSPDELRTLIACADLCLGAFGVTPQSLMTVQNKIYEGLAMGKPVITGDGPAVRAAFRHGEHLYLCPREDPSALADAIRLLKTDSALRNRLSQQGYQFFSEHFTIEHLGATFRKSLRNLVRYYPK